MNQFSSIFRKLKKKLFGIPQSKSKTEPRPPSEIQEPKPRHLDETPSDHKREGYFIQIGFDFGTAYSKCVYRDIIIDKAWVYTPPRPQEEKLPFLIPSALILENNVISHLEDTRIHYHENGLYHLKKALVLVANDHLDDPLLVHYQRVSHLKDTNQLHDFIVTCGVYFLAGTLGEIRKKVRELFPGFGLHSDDYMAINLAVPVEDAQQPKVNRLFNLILGEAWRLADRLSGHPPIPLEELCLLRRSSRTNSSSSADEACFIYPEVSAGVQGFVRSRVSSTGMYLFSDTGGGTVDQSVFIFDRSTNQEKLTYLAARVLPLGSSHIERRAAQQCGKSDHLTLENLRKKKERGENNSELKEAREWIGNELYRGTEGTIALTKKKLYLKDQLKNIRVIFGGGGHCEHPYEKAVICPFSGQLFREAHIPDIIGLPVPSDIELSRNEKHWMKRLNVAYGLSYEKGVLIKSTYPKDVSDPKPEEIWQPRKPTGDAPTKDDC